MPSQICPTFCLPCFSPSSVSSPPAPSSQSPATLLCISHPSPPFIFCFSFAVALLLTEILIMPVQQHSLELDMFSRVFEETCSKVGQLNKEDLVSLICCLFFSTLQVGRIKPQLWTWLQGSHHLVPPHFAAFSQQHGAQHPLFPCAPAQQNDFVLTIPSEQKVLSAPFPLYVTNSYSFIQLPPPQ